MGVYISDDGRNRRYYPGGGGPSGSNTSIGGSGGGSNAMSSDYSTGSGSTYGGYDPYTGLIAAGIGYLGQREANQTNREIADQNRDFQERMANSAHQRQVKDLKKAGLNPILSVNSGAFTPPGSTATVESEAGAGLSSAVEALRLEKEIAGANSAIALNNSTAMAQGAQATRDQATAMESAQRTLQLKAELPAIAGESAFRQKNAQHNLSTADWQNYVKRFGEAAGAVNSAKDALTPKIKIGVDKSPSPPITPPRYQGGFSTR